MCAISAHIALCKWWFTSKQLYISKFRGSCCGSWRIDIKFTNFRYRWPISKVFNIVDMSLIQTRTWKDNKFPLRWRHNGSDGVSNHQPHDCLLSRLFGHRSKKTSKLRVTPGLCAGNSPHKWPVTRKMIPFDDVIMLTVCGPYSGHYSTRWGNDL